MGVKLGRWATRISGLMKLPLLEQVVLYNMANAALDPGPDLKKGEQPFLFYLARKRLAINIYGDPDKARYLDRTVASLVNKGLIEPVGGPAHKGHVQVYRLRIWEYVATYYDILQSMYPAEAQELGRIQRSVLAPT